MSKIICNWCNVKLDENNVEFYGEEFGSYKQESFGCCKDCFKDKSIIESFLGEINTDGDE